jgi:hypothetical protein
MAPDPADPPAEPSAESLAEPPRPEPPDDVAEDDDELLMDGQEEVFARSEVEHGVIEHHSLEEDVQPTPVDPDEPMAENFRAAFNPRP